MAEAQGPDMGAASELVACYLAAWCERRSAARRRLLERCWGDDGGFSSWTTHVQGLDALDAHIAAGQRHTPRRSHRTHTGELFVSGRKVSYTWELVDHDGTVLLEGSDFVELGEHGKISRVTSFAGRPAERPALP